MVLEGKNRAFNPIPSVFIVATTATTTAAITTFKVSTPEMSKSESFASFRQRFKAFYTQVRLYI
jgi:hypothetical protein